MRECEISNQLSDFVLDYLITNLVLLISWVDNVISGFRKENEADVSERVIY